MSTPGKGANRFGRQKIDYRGKMILAPMVKIGTLPFRLLCLSYGADLVYTEEIIDWRILRSERRENEALDTVDYVDKTDDTLVLRVSPQERGKLVLQIGTSDPDRAVRVAKMVEQDVDAIDVNMGCPKGFSLKGGMGAALLTHPDKVRMILTSLVAAVEIPVTCKIRILPSMEDTLALVKVIEATGVSAFAVHGRTKDERPNHEVHMDSIQKVVESATIPVIANGLSSNNRNSGDNTYSGIRKLWKETGADSIMIARGAEWYPAIFSAVDSGRRIGVMELAHRYLDFAIRFDYTFTIVKYTMQQILGGEQEKLAEGAFLRAATMRDMCAAFGRVPEIVERQAWIRSRQEKARSNSKRYMREANLSTVPKKRKLSEIVNNGDDGEDEDVVEMFCPFVRGHYGDNDLPKTALINWSRSHTDGKDDPKYVTVGTEKTFTSVVSVAGRNFSSSSWEKNKRYSEQAAAIVALHCLGIKKLKTDEGKFPEES